MDLIVLIIMVILGYLFGSYAEKKHLESLRLRESQKSFQPLVTDEMKGEIDNVRETKFVSGSVVIGADYFKQFVYGLRNIFGGNARTLESVMDRARREAMLRMRDAAEGADYIIKMRVETSTIGPRQIEAFAYGTAVYLMPNSLPAK